MNWTKEEIDKTIDIIMKKSSIDKGFRKKVLEKPETVIKDISGKDIPTNFKIKVIENKTNYNQTFVLNDFLGEELTDEELDNVAGGRGCGDKCDTYTKCYCVEQRR
ncbi:MAG: NHLP leader peptide family RiPP precursor [Candidatus Muirbacterium halophilum]|nr:NHLP leader peptide family RiPP precursor [Candidatus Muirbacterium halophilum]MCK9476143.1 NHLP leader peptide family RiPP precursor [Candidatus Muirbacterium halophilum]